MLKALTDEELNDHTKINGIAKQRIATASNKPVDEVALMIMNFKQSLILAKWLNMKKKNSETLPDTEKEMQEKDLRIKKISMDVLYPNGMKKTGRKRGQFL